MHTVGLFFGVGGVWSMASSTFGAFFSFGMELLRWDRILSQEESLGGSGGPWLLLLWCVVGLLPTVNLFHYWEL